MSKINDVCIDALNQSFNASEENANERLKEELTFALINDLKMARQGIGILTIDDIAEAIKSGMGDDAETLGRLVQEKCWKLEKIKVMPNLKKVDTARWMEKIIYGV